MAAVTQVQGQNKSDSQNKKNINGLTNIKYRLYPTDNEWIFIKLNTQNGLITQVQFDLKADSRYQTPLNTLSLLENGNEVNDRFTLYPTFNIYTFILLDQIDGRMWQVNWSEVADERDIILIE